MKKQSSCSAHADLSPTGITCPECKKGEIVPTRGRFGLMWACSTRPKCKFWLKARPTGKRCQHKRSGKAACGALMMEGTKTIPQRCSDKECPNHNPHKLQK